jgi:RNA polymerase sigma factor (TIGR02999 family)
MTRDPGEDGTGESGEVTELLAELREGEADALDRLLPLVYSELRRLAQHQMNAERPDHTLSATALVHEAYVKLVGQRKPEWRDRGHFFAVASMAMRRILVNHAVARTRAKRGGDAPVVPLDEVIGGVATGPGGSGFTEERAAEIIALDRALEAFRDVHERAVRVVECRYFSGLSVAETAEALQISPRTVKRDWSFARAWLRRRLS